MQSGKVTSILTILPNLWQQLYSLSNHRTFLNENDVIEKEKWANLWLRLIVVCHLDTFLLETLRYSDATKRAWWVYPPVMAFLPSCPFQSRSSPSQRSVAVVVSYGSTFIIFYKMVLKLSNFFRSLANYQFSHASSLTSLLCWLLSCDTR